MGIALSRPGVISCAGALDELFNAVLHGDQGGITPVFVGGRRFLAGRIGDDALPAAAAIAGFEAFAQTHLARIGAAALEQIRAGVEKAVAAYGAERVGVCVGSCDNGSELSLAAHKQFFASGGEPHPLGSAEVPGAFPGDYDIRFQSAGLLAEYIAAYFGVSGPALTVSTACASSAGAIVKGAELIKAGLCDAVIAGGADIASDTVLLGFAALEAVSPEICNPFSKNRKGITLGDGAAFFVMSEGTEAALELLGWGESADAHHMTAPRADGSGAAAAMSRALANAGIHPEKVDYINLHGTGTPLNDSMEALALTAVFPESPPPVSSTKSITGHTLGAAGALELALCWKALEEAALPAHCWDGVYDETMPYLVFVAVGENGIPGKRPQISMSNSFAFGGCNTSLILGRKAL
jgi:3-oxoacyl-[acyl-carrier-protein] synthase-1